MRAFFRRLACRYYGHQESRLVQWKDGTIWARVCDRCGAANWIGDPL